MSPLGLEVGRWLTTRSLLLPSPSMSTPSIVLGTNGAVGPPRYALDVGELAVARVEEDLVRVGVRAGTPSWGLGVEIGLGSS